MSAGRLAALPPACRCISLSASILRRILGFDILGRPCGAARCSCERSAPSGPCQGNACAPKHGSSHAAVPSWCSVSLHCALAAASAVSSYEGACELGKKIQNSESAGRRQSALTIVAGRGPCYKVRLRVAGALVHTLLQQVRPVCEFSRDHRLACMRESASIPCGAADTPACLWGPDLVTLSAACVTRTLHLDAASLPPTCTYP